MPRKRTRLVPSKAVECFEVRLALFLELDGTSSVAYEISTLDDPKARPPLHEVLGLIRLTEAFIIEEYDRE